MYEPDLILFGSNSGEAALVHFWRCDNPEWDRLASNPDKGESLIAAGFTGFELQDAVRAWRASPERTRFAGDDLAYCQANPNATIYDLRAFRRNWWREVMGR